MVASPATMPRLRFFVFIFSLPVDGTPISSSSCLVVRPI
jgi:hypothetical protein